MKIRYLLSKKEIIKSKKSFGRILKNGTEFKGNYLKIFVYSSDEKRVGFSVSKNVGKAVLRVKVKRWLREIYRRERHGLNSKNDIIILIDSFNSNVNYNTLRSDVLNIFKEINEYFK